MINLGLKFKNSLSKPRPTIFATSISIAMQLFKFGGASVKDAQGVRNLGRIVRDFSSKPLLIVVSAMGKTTNALEKVAQAFFYKNGDAQALLETIKQSHLTIVKELFPAGNEGIYAELDECFAAVAWNLEDEPIKEYDFEYDQIVSLGELVSTKIIAAFLQQEGLPCEWLDARDYVRTDDTWREGRIDWKETQAAIDQNLVPKLNANPNFVGVVQGFVGVTSENYTTTLGREGSDYTASIFAYCLNAQSVTIWKDVPGVLNADPKYFSGTVMLNQISFEDAIELAYYGAGVIHPKTIQPIKNKNIPLYVKSFIHPENTGTVINAEPNPLPVPSFISKPNQVLISITSRDFSFIMEDHLAAIFSLFASKGVKINFMQNSAVSFSVCVTWDEFKIPEIVKELEKAFNVSQQSKVELLTIRYYNQSTLNKLLSGKILLLESKAGETIQIVTKGI